MTVLHQAAVKFICLFSWQSVSSLTFTGYLAFISLKSLKRGEGERQFKKAGNLNFLINPLIPRPDHPALPPSNPTEITEQRINRTQTTSFYFVGIITQLQQVSNVCLWLVSLPSVGVMAGSPNAQNTLQGGFFGSSSHHTPVSLPICGEPLYCQPFGASTHSYPNTTNS